MDGYKVAPQALRTAANAFKNGAVNWQNADKAVDGATLASGDLGLIGETSGFIPGYNTDVVVPAGKALTQGQQRIADAGTKLGTIATTYENKDASYYRMFNYM